MAAPARWQDGRVSHFRRQQGIDHYIVDFYCHQANLVVELDGGVHLEQEEYDRERDLYLQARSLQVMRFTNSEIERELDEMLSVILENCLEHSEGK